MNESIQAEVDRLKQQIVAFGDLSPVEKRMLVARLKSLLEPQSDQTLIGHSVELNYINNQRGERMGSNLLRIELKGDLNLNVPQGTILTLPVVAVIEQDSSREYSLQVPPRFQLGILKIESCKLIHTRRWESLVVGFEDPLNSSSSGSVKLGIKSVAQGSSFFSL